MYKNIFMTLALLMTQKDPHFIYISTCRTVFKCPNIYL